jgi:hypothetical protein
VRSLATRPSWPKERRRGVEVTGDGEVDAFKQNPSDDRYKSRRMSCSLWSGVTYVWLTPRRYTNVPSRIVIVLQ